MFYRSDSWCYRRIEMVKNHKEQAKDLMKHGITIPHIRGLPILKKDYYLLTLIPIFEREVTFPILEDVDMEHVISQSWKRRPIVVWSFKEEAVNEAFIRRDSREYFQNTRERILREALEKKDGLDRQS